MSKAANDISQLGFEFGLKLPFSIIKDPKFSDDFRAAKCIGLLYLWDQTSTGLFPKALVFLFEHETPADNFFAALLKWVEDAEKDGDIVAIDFIETNDGGYTAAIYPEPHRLEKTEIPEYIRDRVVPYFITVTQYKEIPQISDNYLNFKKLYNKSRKIRIGYAIGNITRMEKLKSNSFFKTEFHFYKEDNQDNPVCLLYKGIREKNNDTSKFPKPPITTKEQIEERRNEELKVFFPITMHKLSNGWLITLIEKLYSQGTSNINQAICNLIFLERLKILKQSDTSLQIPTTPAAYLNLLLKNYEAFNSYFPSDDFFTEEKILNQIKNDKNLLDKLLRK